MQASSCDVWEIVTVTPLDGVSPGQTSTWGSFSLALSGQQWKSALVKSCQPAPSCIWYTTYRYGGRHKMGQHVAKGTWWGGTHLGRFLWWRGSPHWLSGASSGNLHWWSHASCELSPPALLAITFWANVRIKILYTDVQTLYIYIYGTWSLAFHAFACSTWCYIFWAQFKTAQ